MAIAQKWGRFEQTSRNEQQQQDISFQYPWMMASIFRESFTLFRLQTHFCSLNYVNRIQRRSDFDLFAEFNDRNKSWTSFVFSCTREVFQAITQYSVSQTSWKVCVTVTHVSNYRADNIKLMLGCWKCRILTASLVVFSATTWNLLDFFLFSGGLQLSTRQRYFFFCLLYVHKVQFLS